jgi:type I restriction enzyme S subunit
VALGDVMRQVQESVRVDLAASYPNLGIYSFGRGLFPKPPIDGARTSAPMLFRVRAGQFIYSRLFAFEGSYGVVPAEMDGWYVSQEYPTFDCDRSKLLPEFIGLYFRRKDVWGLVAAGSKGLGHRRQRVQPAQVLSHRLSLPAVEEQRRIVARIEELATKIEQARRVLDEAGSLAESLTRALLLDPTRPPAKTLMRDIVSLREPNVVVSPSETYPFAGVYSFGRGMFKSVERKGTEFSYPRLTRLRKGDFTYPKLMAWEGAFAIVPDHCDGLVVSTEFPVFELDECRVLPETLEVYFRIPSVWSAVSGVSTGTNVRRRRLNPADFLAFEIPLPSMPTQRRLCDLQRRLRAADAIRTQQLVELDALVPSILDQAFAGKL